MKPIQRYDFSREGDSFKLSSQFRNHPFILQNELIEFPEWTYSYLEEKFSDEILWVRVYGRNKVRRKKNEWGLYLTGFIQSTFRDFYEVLVNGENESRIYLAQHKIKLSSAESRVLDSVCAKVGVIPTKNYNIWYGFGGHREPLHFDLQDGLLFQIKGNKKVVLYPPEQSKNLYPFSKKDAIGWWFSKVSVADRNYDEYPRKEAADQFSISFNLNEGEVLYIPCGWWHEIECDGDDTVCSVNHFFSASVRRLFFRRAMIFLAGVADLTAGSFANFIKYKSHFEIKGIEIKSTKFSLVNALIKVECIRHWCCKDVSEVNEDSFRVGSIGGGFLVEICKEKNNIIWLIKSPLIDLNEGTLIFSINDSFSESVSVTSVHVNVGRNVSGFFKGFSIHSLYSLKDYLEINLGEPLISIEKFLLNYVKR